MIRTSILDDALDSLLILGLIVPIRTFLVVALHLEIVRRLPWKQAEEEEAEQRSQETKRPA